MNRILFASAVAAVALVGCNQSKPGGTPASSAATHSSDDAPATKAGQTATTEVTASGNTRTTEVRATPATVTKGDNTAPTKSSSLPNVGDVLKGTGKNEFTFSVPGKLVSPSMKQGETKELKLTLNRGSEFKESVTFSAEAPKGLKATFRNATVAASDATDVALSVSADKDAPIGKHDIKVTAKPTKGNATTETITVNVDKSAAN